MWSVWGYVYINADALRGQRSNLELKLQAAVSNHKGRVLIIELSTSGRSLFAICLAPPGKILFQGVYIDPITTEVLPVSIVNG